MKNLSTALGGDAIVSSGSVLGAECDRVFARPVEGLVLNWDFVRSARPFSLQVKTSLMLTWRLRKRPKSTRIKPAYPSAAWFVYFMFLPDGRLQPYHLFALKQLRAMGWPVLAVVASPSEVEVPSELGGLVEALYWKAMGGYDFSAYTLAMEELVEHSPGAHVLVMNDSTYGPFQDLRPFVNSCPWDLAGFTASSDTVNHLQSYAFVIKDLSPQKMQHLRSAFPKSFAFNRATDAILWQELRFGEVASRSMSVGSYWFSDKGIAQDPTLRRPFELLDGGFPFMKKSLLGKHGQFQNRELVLERLVGLRHPL